MIKPETIQKHIEIWARKKAIYDRHQAGETYPAIARDLGVPTHNVVRHATEWKRNLSSYDAYLQRDKIRSERDRRRLEYRFKSLVAAGLMGIPMRSPEYGYA